MNRVPKRLPYGNDSVLNNPTIAEAYGDGSAFHMTNPSVGAVISLKSNTVREEYLNDIFLLSYKSTF